MAGEAVRWRRYGKDRLYVTGEDGRKLGYRDLLTGQDFIADAARAAEFEAIVGASPALVAGESSAPSNESKASTAAEAIVPEQREPSASQCAPPLDETLSAELDDSPALSAD